MSDDPATLIRDLSARVGRLEAEASGCSRVVAEQIKGIREDVARLERAVDDAPGRFVSLDRYGPVERLVYGITAAVLMTVVGAVLALVIRGWS